MKISSREEPRLLRIKIRKQNSPHQLSEVSKSELIRSKKIVQAPFIYLDKMLIVKTLVTQQLIGRVNTLGKDRESVLNHMEDRVGLIIRRIGDFLPTQFKIWIERIFKTDIHIIFLAVTRSTKSIEKFQNENSQ